MLLTIFKDNPEFYPTPEDLFRHLVSRNKRLDGRILEPSAGSGHLIRHIKNLNRYGGGGPQIDAIEKDSRLSNQLMADGVSVVWDDFLTYETYKEYDYIVMNPPFSNGVDHVLKALELAENQLSHCEIYAILNKNTIDNAYSSKRQELLRRLDDHNAEIRYVSDGFSDADRKTDVEVALIHVKVEKKGEGRNIYDSIPFFTADREETEEAIGTSLATYVQSSEIQSKLNDIERLVLEYETACELAKETFEAMRNKSSFFSYISTVNTRDGERPSPLHSIIPYNKEFKASDLNEELDSLRRGYWELILDTKDFREMLTNEAIQKLNRQMTAANAMEVNLANVRMLLTALGANQKDILTDSIISIFEKITKYHMNEYSSNIHYYDGWKTNNAYKINKKVVIPISYRGFDSFDFGNRRGSGEMSFDYVTFDVKHWILDIIKAFKLIDPNISDEFTPISKQEFENDLLRFKMFLNGNIHVWFKDLRLLAKLNYLCGSHFNWIPSDGEQKDSEEARKWVAKEFGDIGEVKLLQTKEGGQS